MSWQFFDSSGRIKVITDISDNTSIQKVEVSDNGSYVGARKRLNLIATNEITLGITDDSGNDEIDVSVGVDLSGKQPLDATLTAIAGATTGADKVIYFTGVDIAGTFDITAFGRTLVNAADASAARTTLGLGTAALKNTGTSGDTVPLLDGTNDWSQNQRIAKAAATLDLGNSGGAIGPHGLRIYGNNVGGLEALLVYRTSGGGYFVFEDQAGTVLLGINRSNGVIAGSPTGSYKGAGTINAQAVYDDNTLLTCYILEAEIEGNIDLNKWNNIVPDRIIPAREAVVEKRPKKGNPNTIEDVVVSQGIPEKVEVRTHKPAAKFAARASMMLDPKQYAEFWKSSRHLPSMPSPDEWAAAGSKLPTGDLIQRLWETVEVQAVHIDKLLARIEALEAK